MHRLEWTQLLETGKAAYCTDLRANKGFMEEKRIARPILMF